MNSLMKDVGIKQAQHHEDQVHEEAQYKITSHDTQLARLRKHMVINATVSERLSRLTSKNITAQNIQQLTKKDHNMWHELGRGKAILSELYHLEQYFYSYGPMICKQWSEVRKVININSNLIDIFDYGCGQGIGTANILDHLRSGNKANNQDPRHCEDNALNPLSNVININLIEPSPIALSRANRLLNIYPTQSSFNLVNKELNELAVDDLKYTASSTKIHIFSNILDIGSFDQLAVLEKILSIKGDHYLVAVSPQSSDGGVRMTEIYNKIVRSYKAKSHQKWDLTYKTQIHNAFFAYLEV